MHDSCLEWFSQRTEPISQFTQDKTICRHVALHHSLKDARWTQFPDAMQNKDNLYWRHLKSQVHYYRRHLDHKPEAHDQTPHPDDYSVDNKKISPVKM